jgi:hypothetical protein
MAKYGEVMGGGNKEELRFFPLCYRLVVFPFLLATLLATQVTFAFVTVNEARIYIVTPVHKSTYYVYTKHRKK